MSKTTPSLRTKLAAALLRVLELEGRPIDLDASKQLTAHQIVSLFHFDHYPIPEAFAGPTEPWNLVPRLIKEHRAKTAKVDVPAIRKTGRIAKKHAEFRARLLAKDGKAEPVVPARKSRWASRPMQSRPFPKKRSA